MSSKRVRDTKCPKCGNEDLEREDNPDDGVQCLECGHAWVEALASDKPLTKEERMAAAGVRKAVPPEPKRYPQCRNCKHLTFDSLDYAGARGEVHFKKANLRCKVHNIAVLLSCVCDAHVFAYHDRADR